MSFGEWLRKRQPGSLPECGNVSLCRLKPCAGEFGEAIDASVAS